MKTKLHFGLFILAALLISTAPAQAYKSGAKSAAKLTPNHQLYSIDFTWGFKDSDLLIPVLATRGLENATTAKALGYELESVGGLRVKSGTTTAMVIAKLPIENGYYRLEAGQTAKFTLLALHQAASSTQMLKLHTTALPFKFDNKGKETQTFLREHELKDYVTKAI